MVSIQDHSNCRIRVTPEFTNWWTFHFEFFYGDKAIFNPEITDGNVLSADEHEGSPLLPVLEAAVESVTDGEIFAWSAWEEEVTMEIEVVMKNIDKGMDGGFHFTVFASERCFKDGEMNYGFQNVGVKLFLNRVELRKFLEELNAEMAEAVERGGRQGEISGSMPKVVSE